MTTFPWLVGGFTGAADGGVAKTIVSSVKSVPDAVWYPGGFVGPGGGPTEEVSVPLIVKVVVNASHGVRQIEGPPGKQLSRPGY